MGLEDLLVALERRAQREIRTKLEAARGEAREIRAAAAERTEQRRTEILAARRAELERRLEESVSEARRAARARELRSRERFVERVFEAAVDRLDDAVQSSRYRAELSTHVEQVLGYFDGPLEIRCRPALYEAVSDVTADCPDVRVVADPEVDPGLKARDPDGSLTVDNTLPGRLERLRPRLAIEVLAALEGSDA